jgi:hypothetical protein
VAAGAFNDTLTVNTSAPGAAASTIALQESAQGAILGLVMDSTGFSDVVAGNTGTLPFTVTNKGNLDAPITLSPSGAGFGAAFTGTSTAGADGGTAAGNATFTPTAAGTADGSLSISTTTVTCAPLPGAESLSGTGVGPVGAYTSPLVLDVTCGGAAGTATLTITNDSAYPLTADGARSVNGLFTVTSATNITVAANGGTGSFAIQTAAVAQGAKASSTYPDWDYLDFQTNEFGSPTRSVPVNLQVNGANLVFTTASTLDLTNCDVPSTITVENTGNQAATVTVPANMDGMFFTGFSAVAYVASSSVAANDGTVNTAVQSNGVCGDSSETFTFTGSGGNVCEGTTLPLTVNWDIPCGGPCS